MLANWTRVVNSASLFEGDDVPFLRLCRAGKAPAQQRTPVLLAQALHRHVADRVAAGEADARGAVVSLLVLPALDQNPDFMSYALGKWHWRPRAPSRLLALAPRVRVVGVAPGLTLTSHVGRRKVCSNCIAPGLGCSSRRRRGNTVKFALKMIHHRHHAAGGRGQHLMKFERDFS